MPSFGQFSAHIAVGEANLPEYGVEVHESAATVTCWIPSEEGKEFIVKWKDCNNKCDLSGDVQVDGVKVGGRTTKHRPGRRVVKGKKQLVRTSSASGRPLVFSKVKLTDDDEYLEHSTHEHLGEIRLTLWHIKITGNSPRSGPSSRLKLPDSVKLHERTKKAVAHCVAAGNEAAYREHSATQCTTIRTLVTFIFKYRPLALLQAEDIAPLVVQCASGKKRAGSSSTKAESSRSRGDSITLERIAALEREIRTLRQSAERPAKRRKTEVKSESRSASKSVNHLGTLDLTLDD